MINPDRQLTTSLAPSMEQCAEAIYKIWLGRGEDVVMQVALSTLIAVQNNFIEDAPPEAEGFFRWFITEALGYELSERRIQINPRLFNLRLN